jgi:hypothetical protein
MRKTATILCRIEYMQNLRLLRQRVVSNAAAISTSTPTEVSAEGKMMLEPGVLPTQTLPESHLR